MDSRTVAAFLALLLASATLSEGASLALAGGELRCQCINTHSAYIPPKHIATVKLISSGPHCAVIQVIVTLKNGNLVCLDPTAEWVKKVIKYILNNPQANTETQL